LHRAAHRGGCVPCSAHRQSRPAPLAGRRAAPRAADACARTPGIVEIDSAGRRAVESGRRVTGAKTPSQVVVIAPIDVEPVRISQLELVE
jgi:hypothetical protein